MGLSLRRESKTDAYIRHLEREVEWLRTIAAPFIEAGASTVYGVPTPAIPDAPPTAPDPAPELGTPPVELDEFKEWVQAGVDSGMFTEAEGKEILAVEEAAQEHGF